MNPLKSLALTCSMLFAVAASALAEPAAMPNVSPAVTEALQAGGKTDVIVRLDMDANPSAAAIASAQNRLNASLASVRGWRMQRRLESMPYVIGQIDSEGLTALAANPAVAKVMEDLPMHGALAQSVPAINANTASSVFKIYGTGIVVGFIDTGIDLANTDLAGAVQASRRIIKGDSNTTNVQDDNGHGTHLAGIITGDGAVASKGVATACKLVVIKALDKNMSGYMSDFIAGIDWIITNHASFPSLKYISLGANFSASPSTLCPCDSLVGSVSAYQAFIDAINRAKAAGILIAVPAGNEGQTGLVPPACFNNVISVGATFDSNFLRAPATGTYHDYGSVFPAVYDSSTNIQTLAGFSDRGPCLDLVAPGYNITSDRVGGGTLGSFGTSMSMAHVVGALALLQQRAPTATAEQLVLVLKATGRSVPDPSNGSIKYPLIDVYAAASLFGRNLARQWTVYE
ncbi:S8 family serine peptidase [bacterium]|nr:S8 family serine peptidase [bacterium]